MDLDGVLARLQSLDPTTKVTADATEAVMADLDEPTEDERKNGWDADSLAKYRAERERSQLEHADWTQRPQPLPAVQNNRYSPLRWRR